MGFTQSEATKRDYRLGDNAVVGSLEARFTVLRDKDFGNIEITPFFDIGTVWNNQEKIPSPSTLASLGLQLGWYWENFQFLFSYGVPLIPINESSDSNFDFRLQWVPLRF